MKSYDRYIEAKNLNGAGDNYKALEIFNDLYAEEPENDLINYGLASTLLTIHNDIRNHPEIEQQIRKHINQSDKFKFELLGQLEEKLGNLDVAKKQYKKAIKFNNNWSCLYYLLMLEQKLGNIDEARECYNRFSEIVKNESETKNNLNYKSIYLLGKSAMEVEDNEVAREIFNYLIDCGKYQQGSIKGLIRIDIKTKNYEEAYKRSLLLNEKDGFKKSSLYIFLLHKLSYLNNLYYKRQLLEYDKERTIKNMVENNKDEFLDYVDLTVMFHICDRNIKSLTPVKRNGDTDKYYIDFTSDIGHAYGIKTNRVSVITIADTKDIINITPIITEHKKNENNYTPSDGEKNPQKSKKISRIEEFNRKYNLK